MFRKTVQTRVIKKKFNLSALLHETIQKQWDEIRTVMFKFPYFNKWDEASVHQCCVHSNFLNFEENDLIYVKDDANVFVTYFILEGSATVIQRLIVKKYRNKGDKWDSYKLHTALVNDVASKDPGLETVYMQTCILNAGACFGLGENLSKGIIKANVGLKCLVIPKHIILQNFTPDNIWQRIILYLNMNYPTREEVFKEFVKGRERRRLSKSLYKYKLNMFHRPTNTVIHDVPLSLRTEDIVISSIYKKRAEKYPFYLFGEWPVEEHRAIESTKEISLGDLKNLPELMKEEAKWEKKDREEADKISSEVMK